MDAFVLITKYSLGCSFHSDNFYITTLHICSQQTAFWCFYGRNAVPLVFILVTVVFDIPFL